MRVQKRKMKANQRAKTYVSSLPCLRTKTYVSSLPCLVFRAYGRLPPRLWLNNLPIVVPAIVCKETHQREDDQKTNQPDYANDFNVLTQNFSPCQ
jgi:hypothetical protein